MKKITIAVVDDHPAVRIALEHVLNTIPEFVVLYTAENGEHFFKILEKTKLVPNVVLMDVEMPVMNGFTASEKLHANYPHSKILMFSTHIHPLFIQKAILCNCNGFLEKGSDTDTIKDAIFEAYYTGHFHNNLFNPERIEELLTESKEGIFTEREKELLRLLHMGKPSEEIAKEMNVEIETLYKYKHRIKIKLDCTDETDFHHFLLQNNT